RRKYRPRLRGIGGDLGLELVEARKFLLWTQVLDECDAQVLAVEIVREIEQMRLEAEVGTAHRGPGPEIGNALVPAAGGPPLPLPAPSGNTPPRPPGIAPTGGRGREPPGAAAPGAPPRPDPPLARGGEGSGAPPPL